MCINSSALDLLVHVGLPVRDISEAGEREDTERWHMYHVQE